MCLEMIYFKGKLVLYYKCPISDVYNKLPKKLLLSCVIINK